MESINRTAALEALSPFLNNPRRTVSEVEVFTSLIVLLLLPQLFLGSLRRQSTSHLVQASTWMTYTVLLPAIAYTLGLMQSSPVKNVMYTIWAVSLLIAAGGTNAVKVYELNDNRQWKRGVFSILQYYIYATLICYVLHPQSHQKLLLSRYFATFRYPTLVIIVLSWVAMIMGACGRELACLLVENGYYRARRVAKFMKKLPDAAAAAAPASDGDGEGYKGSGPASMTFKGYKYLVHLAGFGGTVTIDQIWQCEGSLLSSGTIPDHCKVLKDTSLAFAMYQLLKQRYHGITLNKECREGTRDFLLNGLLQTESAHKRAFRIVEMELGFFHDNFFTKHAAIFELEVIFFILFIVKILLILVVVYFVLQNTMVVKTPNAIIEVHTTRIDRIITILVLATILLVEIMQAAFYLASDWCKVSVACRYATSTAWYLRNAFVEKLISYLSRYTIFGYWKNSIGQYLTVLGVVDSDLSGSDFQTVKQAIIRSLISCDGPPTNGEGSLGRNNVLEEFSWALRGQSQAEIMLMWNVATYYCHAAVSGGDGFNRQVSVSTSRYCAYLMKYAPELLPGNFGDTKSAMTDVQADFYQILKSPYFIISQAMDDFQDKEEGKSIFMRGVKLGRQLKASATCWKIIADFWAEKILYVAPTDNVKGHMEILAKGGEFLTHI